MQRSEDEICKGDGKTDVCLDTIKRGDCLLCPHYYKHGEKLQLTNSYLKDKDFGEKE